MASPTAADDVVHQPVGRAVPDGPGVPVRIEPVDRAASADGPDAPVRVEVAMPRDLFDRLTEHDDAPRCRYDEITGRAEFVAEPGVAHEEPAVAASQFFGRLEDALAEHGRVVSWRFTGALRLLSGDGAFEADASFYLDAAAARAVEQVRGYVDVRAGLPPPTLVVEIDRGRRSRRKLGPYFRMGVEEVWTNHRLDRAIIWRAADTAEGCGPVEDSAVCPGVMRADLDRLFSAGSPSARARFSRALAGRVAARMLAAAGPR